MRHLACVFAGGKKSTLNDEYLSPSFYLEVFVWHATVGMDDRMVTRMHTSTYRLPSSTAVRLYGAHADYAELATAGERLGLRLGLRLPRIYSAGTR